MIESSFKMRPSVDISLALTSGSLYKTPRTYILKNHSGRGNCILSGGIWKTLGTTKVAHSASNRVPHVAARLRCVVLSVFCEVGQLCYQGPVPLSTSQHAYHVRTYIM